MSNLVLLKQEAEKARSSIKALGELVLDLKKNPTFGPSDETPDIDKGEIIANIMLSYRHLEDARMRMGRAILAIDGGKTVEPEQNKGNFACAKCGWTSGGLLTLQAAREQHELNGRTCPGPLTVA